MMHCCAKRWGSCKPSREAQAARRPSCCCVRLWKSCRSVLCCAAGRIARRNARWPTSTNSSKPPRPYDISGLQAFAQAVTAQWKDAQRSMEGRPDTEQQSVSLVTMHASKGLEWPVVVPINMGGQLKAQVHAALDADGRLHLPIFGRHGPGAEAALQAEREELERERHRIWYVAATRARDLLLLPEFSTGVPKNSWMERFGLQHHGLDPFNADHLPDGKLDRTEDEPNTQDRATFDTEARTDRRQDALHTADHPASGRSRRGRRTRPRAAAAVG